MGTVGVAILASLLGVVRFSLGTLPDVLNTAFSLLLCYLGVALISFVANLVRTPALLEDELKTKLDAEISELREQNIKLSKKPYDEALEKEVADLLAKLPPGAEKLLKFLLLRGESGLRGIPDEFFATDEDEEKESIFNACLKSGLLKSRVETVGFEDFRLYYSIRENFIPVLRELLYRKTQD